MPLAPLRGTEIFYEVLGDGEPLVFLNGQLRSGKPPVRRMDEHVDDLLALLDLLEIDRTDVVGTSYGG